MAKAELGTKRVCPDTGRKFYDLGKTPVISPYTGKIVPIAAPTAARAKPEPVTARPTREAEVETVTPETAEAEFVSLEDAEAEQQGKKPAPAAAEGTAPPEGEDVEMDESLDDAAFIEEEEEGNADVTDIIGETIEKEEET